MVGFMAVGAEGVEEEEDVDESCSLAEKEEENGSHGFVSFPNISNGNLAGKSGKMQVKK